MKCYISYGGEVRGHHKSHLVTGVIKQLSLSQEPFFSCWSTHKEEKWPTLVSFPFVPIVWVTLPILFKLRDCLFLVVHCSCEQNVLLIRLKGTGTLKPTIGNFKVSLKLNDSLKFSGTLCDWLGLSSAEIARWLLLSLGWSLAPLLLDDLNALNS